MGGMSQSAWIATAVLAGFLIYLSIKGKLGTYWAMLTGGAAPAASSGAASSGASSPASSVGAIAGAAAGPAAVTLPGVVAGTVTQNQQTTPQYFPMIPSGPLTSGLTLPAVTF